LGDALERAPDERARFLNVACADAPELRNEVESLLAAYDTRGPVDQLADAVFDAIRVRDEDQIGRRVGPYRLVRVIDYGGMGAVYLAEREDGQFSQRVALKLIRLGMYSDQVLRRFLEERQILARLEHPNIARLLDGGFAENGQPYFAMEYVAGLSITQYCDTRRLSIESRLRLFLQVCAAVQYAHQNLIVHRDLKPSNILVRSDGLVKLLDFGIAKLLAAEATNDSAVSATTMRWLTPEYASPEQVCGEPITTAADVYSLGLLLYELLSGHRAYRWTTVASLADIERLICEVQPERPSLAVERTEEVMPSAVAEQRATNLPQLRRLLDGDLDTIVLQTLRKEPARRYTSAAQLAQDIERHLSGLTVSARPDTIRYRASKFVRRHRVAVAAAALVAITLLVGIAATGWQARVAKRQERIARAERDRARLETTRAQQLSTFVLDLFKASDGRSPNDTITARQLVDQGLTQLERELKDQPGVSAAMLDVIGRLYQNLGRDDQTIQVWQKALALRRASRVPDDPGVAETLTRLGLLYHRMEHYELAEPYLQEALDLWTRRLDRENDDLALVMSSLADIEMVNGNLDRAEELYRQAIAVHWRVLGQEHPLIAGEMDNLGMLLLHTKSPEADSVLRQALAMKQRLLPPDHEDFLASYEALGASASSRGADDEAQAFQEKSLALREKLQGDSHVELTFTLMNLAAVVQKKGDLARAEALYRRAIAIRRTVPIYRASLSKPLTDLGKVLQAQGKCAESDTPLREALALRVRETPPATQQIAEVRTLLTSCNAQGAR
jgi:serine/threonine-protein kinase